MFTSRFTRAAASSLSLHTRVLPSAARVARFSQAVDKNSLKKRVGQLIPVKLEENRDIKQKYGDRVLGEVTVAQAYGGARDVPCMIYETSLLDAQEGIRFRGLSIPELQQQLPRPEGASEPYVESILWLLLTGEVPTKENCEELRLNLAERSRKVPQYVLDLIAGFPKDMHPMTQFSMAILALQPQSKFSKAYAKGVAKHQYWDYVFEDILNLVAQLPVVAANIYRHSFKDGKTVMPAEGSTLDLSAEFARMLGFNNKGFEDLLRLYLVIHSDHEGGNVSAHTVHLVGSALSDPYYSLAAGMCGLAGPLHGLANQEVLTFLKQLDKDLQGKDITNSEIIEATLWDILNSNRVIPGYGHAVLRKTDPRYICQREFALKHLPEDRMFKLVSKLYEVAPTVLLQHGKTKNPWPNVDAHSGILLQHYGLVEENFYTVLFGVSRAMGVLSQMLWSRALGYPIERPKSLTSEWIVERFKDEPSTKEKKQKH
eukprot:CAMPEP_0177653320 /NCGR_PEP_ID=MMETSP0447-20121125/13670_1 /TAXON_ID=0 /ORGANISM="Stygamoeba regulata, Strain BSH-02190019" /LENGTH=484 /DNA_ID=CAMNT_0019156763 /DNA_START=31 /DNA_END=1485 /DNA_ORIENTATION=-